MNIKQSVDDILRSEAFQKVLDGESDKDLEILLIQFGYHVYERTVFNMVRRYGKVKFFTTEHIKADLKDIPPPENLQLNTK